MLVMLPVLCKMGQQNLDDNTWFTKNFKLIVETYCSKKKKFLSKYYCLLTVYLGHPRALMEMYL